MTQEYILFGIENPLLDISAVVKPELLTKYGLNSNDAILAEDKHKPLYTELVENYPVVYIAGGAAQNTLRGAQWLLPPKSTVYVGAVGKDKECDILNQAASKDGLRTEYQITDLPTGKCAVLITGTHRSMVTDLQAANAFSIDHLEKPEIWSLVTAAKYYYVGGYFLTVSPPSAMKIAKHAVEHGKPFALNLSAPFVPQFFKEPMDALLPYTEVVFGNEAEAESFAQSHEYGTTDVKEIALKVAAIPRNFSRPRLVVFTQGVHDTVVAYDGKIQTFPIIKIAPEKIVDTNGAGDAFVGGFLSQYVQGASVKQCVAAGLYVAHTVIQRTGPSYPSEPHSFFYSE
ncbi:adenosine kinase [Kappamyces sp. JEL0829]|nr:adenosine kinase [Kappamyces sp. JEL0829]KAJ3355527.1 adenosine kinase [Kappamyces sp. JEL0680]